MDEFRCYWLDSENKIIHAKDVTAANLSAAIEAAQKLCEELRKSHPERIEVWQGKMRLYP